MADKLKWILVSDRLKWIIPWLLTLIFGGTTGHFMSQVDAEITFSDGVLKSIHVLGEKCR